MGAQSQGWFTPMNITVKSQVSGREWRLGSARLKLRDGGLGLWQSVEAAVEGVGTWKRRDGHKWNCEGLARDVGGRERREAGKSFHE